MACCRDEKIVQIIAELNKRGLKEEATKVTEVVARGWGGLPKGWTMDSALKFWNSLTGDRVHKVTQCIKKMSPHMDNPGAFCGGLASFLGKR